MSKKRVNREPEELNGGNIAVAESNTDQPPMDDMPPDDIPPETENTKTLGEMLAEKEANGEPPKQLAITQPISFATPEAAQQVLTKEEEQQRLHEALLAHTEKSKANSATYFNYRMEESGLQSELTALREQIKEHVKNCMQHDAAVPTLESLAQREITFDVQQDALPSDSEYDARYGLPSDQLVDIFDTDTSADILIGRLLKAIPVGDKPLQIKDNIVTVTGVDYIVRDVRDDNTRFFLQPVVSKDVWQQIYEEKFGRCIESFDQNDEAKTMRIAGGEDCGRVVKNGRSKVVIGPESDGLVIFESTGPQTPDSEPDAKQRASGDDD